MKRRAALWVAMLAVGLPFAGRAVEGSAKRDLAVSFYEKRIQEMTSSGLTLGFVFKVGNASSSPWYLTGYDYRVVVDSTPYLALNKELAEPSVVPPSGSTLIALPVKITNANLFRAVPAAAGKDKLSCYLIGGLTFSDEPQPGGARLSVACSGDFPVYRDIEIIPKPLEVKDVTIGGGDMVFKVGVRNNNPFPLQVESFRYVLDLGGTTVSEGRLAADMGLAAQSEKEFVVPLLLDFFELGNSLYAALQKPAVACKFSGTIEFSSDWGRFAMPLEKSDMIPVAPAR
ncbi:MAG: LEA type 2 family protein [Candidatus Aminicenantes bacterium]|nr:LEA type 2 family protein [Candidatus Aminicenantes bacterium]